MGNGRNYSESCLMARCNISSVETTNSYQKRTLVIRSLIA